MKRICLMCQEEFEPDIDPKSIGIINTGGGEPETFDTENRYLPDVLWVCGSCSQYIPGANEPEKK